MKNIFLCLCCVLGLQVFAEENVTGLFVYPSSEYSPKCVQFCKDNNVGSVYMHYTFFKKGLADIYKDAGIKTYCGWLPYKKMWEMEPELLRKWVNDEISEKGLNSLSGFEIDEPLLGYGDWKKQSLPDVETDRMLIKLYTEKFGKAPPLSRSTANSQEWRELLAMRQRLYWEKLKNTTDALRSNYQGKALAITLSPCGYESGPATGFDINLLGAGVLPDDVRLSVDPYFQAFRRPLQWSGYMIRWFRNAANGRKLEGVIEFYDPVKHSGWPHEGYISPDSSDIRRQFLEYLMNGATEISAFVMGVKIYAGSKYEKDLADGLGFVEKSRKYWENTVPESQAGIYFSENTFRMHDMWGPWSRMTGLYGASFQTEWTYYALSSRHIPTDIVSVVFNDEKGLLEKLRKYKVVILPDVKCVSPYEAGCFKKYAEEGGCVVVSGETSFLDRNGDSVKETMLLDLMGIKRVSRGNEASIRFVKNGFIPELAGAEISVDGNAARLFKEQADRHPQWLKEKCVKMKFDGYDLKFAEKLPEASVVKLTPSTAEVLAVYPDDSAAITVNKFGKGKCIYIAPSDLTLFKGKVHDSLEEDSVSKANLDFMEKLLAACIGKKTFELAGGENVEAACRRSADGRKIYIYLLNHSEKTAENVSLRFSDPAISKAIAFEQESCSATEIKKDESAFRIPPFKYGMIVEAETGK